MARSSMTSTLNTAGVSALPRRPRSLSTLAAIPDELTQVTPPSRTAAVGDHPRSNPTATPGSALKTPSAMPAPTPVRSPVRSSEEVYSSPSVSRSKSTPISGHEPDEVVAHRDLSQATVAEREPRHQVERDRGDARSRSDPRQQREPHEEKPELDERERRLAADRRKHRHRGPRTNRRTAMTMRRTSILSSPRSRAASPGPARRVWDTGERRDRRAATAAETPYNMRSSFVDVFVDKDATRR